CWFLSEDKTQLIQVQRDRLWRNWRQVEGNEPYPRIGRITENFQTAWEQFLAFADEQELGPVNVNQCELNYVNHIERGVGWSELGELDRLSTLLRPREPDSFLPPPETLSWQASYKLPEGFGRLYAALSPI